MIKLSKLSLWILTTFVVVFSASIILTAILFSPKLGTVDAFNSSSGSNSYVEVPEIYDIDGVFVGSRFNTLISYLSSDGTLNGVNASNQTAADIRAYTYGGKTNGQSVVVTLGGYKWQVVYLTTNNEGDRIATLLMFDYDGTSTYGNNSAFYGPNNFTTDYPTSMYGTSYIRAVTLNNGGVYADIKNNSNNPTDDDLLTATQSVDHKYALFTVPLLGLTQFLEQPRNMPYQTKSQLTGSNNPTNYTLNNESLSRVSSGWFNNSATSYSYQDRDYYTQWGTDYLWLPSLSETGTSDSELGIWELSTTERAASTSPASSWWSRSGDFGNSRIAYLLFSSGYGSNNTSVNSSCGVRAALHLNLDSAALRVAQDDSHSITASVSSDMTDFIKLNKNEAFTYPNLLPQFTATAENGYYISHITVNGTQITPSNNSSSYTQGVGYKIKCYRVENEVQIILDDVSTNINIVVYGSQYNTNVNVEAVGLGLDLLYDYTYSWVEDNLISTQIVAQFSTNKQIRLFIDGARVELVGNSNTGGVLIDGTTITYSHSIYDNYVNITVQGMPIDISHRIIVTHYTGSGSSVTTSFSGGSGSVTVTSSDSDVQRLVVKPNNNSGGQTCYIGSIVIDGMEFSLDYYSAYLFGAGTASSIRYTTSDTSNAVVLEITGLGEPMHIEFNITTVRPEYDVPPTSGGGVGISGSTVVTAGLGGEARIVGMDNTAETGDTVSLMAVAYSGYRFVGWVDATDESTILSTSASTTFDKADVSGMVLKALFVSTSQGNSANSTTDNGTLPDIL